MKQRLLIARDSEEYKQMKLSESKKSRSTVDLYKSSSSSDSEEEKKEAVADFGPRKSKTKLWLTPNWL